MFLLVWIYTIDKCHSKFEKSGITGNAYSILEMHEVSINV